MDTQTQDVLRQILLKLGGLESSVARQDETLKLGGEMASAPSFKNCL